MTREPSQVSKYLPLIFGPPPQYDGSEWIFSTNEQKIRFKKFNSSLSFRQCVSVTLNNPHQDYFLIRNRSQIGQQKICYVFI